ncbi:MAG TPA: 4Fe-4S dicluster domain-containing protein [Candidatus Methylomirabilis sp.]|nr:4Fe-4S dicluster domain-containing protein [Candidatus Methylomirabilis sp.]
MRVKLSIAAVQGEFSQQVEAISGQPLLACNQCGKCSAGCPVASSMDILPNQVIRLAQLGIEDVLDSQMIWACAACMNCVAHCPKGIDLPRVMEALRLAAMRRKGDRLTPDQLPAQALGELPQLAIIGGFRKYST